MQLRHVTAYQVKHSSRDGNHVFTTIESAKTFKRNYGGKIEKTFIHKNAKG
jgi:hypothetical protein